MNPIRLPCLYLVLAAVAAGASSPNKWAPISSRSLSPLFGLALAAGDDAKKSIADLSHQIKKAIEAGREEDAIAQLKELAEVRTPESIKALFDLGVLIPIPKVFKATAEMLSGMTDEASLKFFEDEAKNEKDEPHLIFLCDVLAVMKHDKAPEILGLLVEKKDNVLRSAIAALGKQKVRGAVEPLLKVLERLETSGGKATQVYQELRDAIFEVTGQDFDRLQDWKNWWETHQATFDPSKKEEGVTQTRKASREKAPEFAGKKIFGKNVVFVIDTSGSMMYVMKDDIPGLSFADGSDRAGGQRQSDEKLTHENQRLAKFWTRMEMAKRALIKALEGFDARARIDIVEFNTKVSTMEKGLVPIANNRKKAIDWVLRMKHMAYTNTKEAIEKAFAIDKSVTEIYFLSDGIPSADGKKNDPPEPILEKVESLNRFRKVKIHTFGFDAISVAQGVENDDLVKANDFLKKLAKRTGGTFTLMKVTDEKPPKDFH